jgi:hypothetical protein
MDKAFDAIAAGEVDTEIVDEYRQFTFEGFSLLLGR